MGTSTLFTHEVAELYAQHRGTCDEEFVDEIASHLDPAAGALVDVGAGCGTPADALQRRGFDVVAVEPSGAMIDEGRRRYPSVPFVQGAGESLPLADAAFGSAVVMYVLHHVDDPELVLAEARRVVRPSGRVVVVSGTADCSRQRLFARYFPTLVPDLPDAQEISIYAAAAGLRLVESGTAFHWVYPNRVIDDAYVGMVSTEMFSALASLKPLEFEDGIERLRRDVGLPLPPAEATVLVFDRR